MTGEKIEFENYNETISDTILLTQETRTRKIRIFIKWNDNQETQTMTNAEDTNATKSSNPALFNVNIAFTQITESENTVTPEPEPEP